MYLHHLLVYLPWTNAYNGLTSVPLSNHHIDNAENKHPQSFMSAQLLVTLTGPSPATFATDNTTRSLPPIEKNQAPNTENTKPANAKLQDTSECPEQEDLDCDECGGQIYNKEEGLFRCAGAENDQFKWKDCFFMSNGPTESCPYEPQGATLEEIAEVFNNLPEWTSDSFSRTPPVSSIVTQRDEPGKKDPLEEIREGLTGAGT